MKIASATATRDGVFPPQTISGMASIAQASTNIDHIGTSKLKLLLALAIGYQKYSLHSGDAFRTRAPKPMHKAKTGQRRRKRRTRNIARPPSQLRVRT